MEESITLLFIIYGVLMGLVGLVFVFVLKKEINTRNKH